MANLSITGTTGQIGGCTIAGAGATPAIKLAGPCKITFSQGVCAGTTGNNDVGLDLTAAAGAEVIIVTTPTVTGALGDVRLADGRIITWAQARAGIVDEANNTIIGIVNVTKALRPAVAVENLDYFKGQLALAFGQTRFAIAFDDFVDAVIGAKWQLNPPVVAAPSLDNSFSGGFVKFQSDGDLIYKATNPFLPAPRAVKWAIGGRVIFPSGAAGLNAGEERFIALRADGSNYLAVGLFKDISTTKFVFKTIVGGVVVSALSTVSLDANIHDWMLFWNPATGLWGSIDEEQPVLVTATATDLYSGAVFERHGLTTPTNNMLIDAVFCAIQSTGV